jgi:hypothetical protein
MSAPEDPRDELDEDLALADDRVHRLLDIVTQEVSLVNRAANRRRWLVRKGTETMEGQKKTEGTKGDETKPAPVEKKVSLPKAIKDSVLKLVGTAQARLEKLVSGIKGMKEEAEAKGLPSEAASEFKGVATALRAINSRYPAPKAKGEGEGEDEDAGAGEQGAADDGGEQKPKAKPKETLPHITKEELEKAAISAAVKTKAIATVESASKRLAAVLSQVEGAEEKDGGEESMPEALAKELEAIAAVLEAVAGAEPEPKAAEKGEEGEEGEADEKQAESLLDVVKSLVAAVPEGSVSKSEDAEQRAHKLLWKVMGLIDRGELAPEEDKAAVEAIFGAVKTAVAKADEGVEKQLSARDALKQARAVIGSVMSKIKPGQAIDEDSYQKLDKLKAALDSAGSEGGEGDGDKGGKDGEDKSVEKQTCAYCKAEATKVVVCGDDTKIASCNLHLAKAREDAKEHGGVKSEEAVKVEKAGAKMSRARRKRFEDAIKSLLSLFKEVMPTDNLGKFPHLVVSKAETEAAELRAKLAKSEQDIAAVRKELSEAKERPAVSQVTPVETTAPAPSPAGDVEWPLDLNAE